MTSDAANKPVDTIRDGNIRAVIWRNSGDKGSFYSVEFNRSYNDGQEWHDTKSFNGSSVLKVARLALKAYDRVGELQSEDKDEAKHAAPEGPTYD